MALTVEDATRMIDAADRAGVRLYVAESMSTIPWRVFFEKCGGYGTGVGVVGISGAAYLRLSGTARVAFQSTAGWNGYLDAPRHSHDGDAPVRFWRGHFGLYERASHSQFPAG